MLAHFVVERLIASFEPIEHAVRVGPRSEQIRPNACDPSVPLGRCSQGEALFSLGPRGAIWSTAPQLVEKRDGLHFGEWLSMPQDSIHVGVRRPLGPVPQLQRVSETNTRSSSDEPIAHAVELHVQPRTRTLYTLTQAIQRARRPRTADRTVIQWRDLLDGSGSWVRFSWCALHPPLTTDWRGIVATTFTLLAGQPSGDFPVPVCGCRLFDSTHRRSR
jgi:hypothetical protein